MSSRKEKAISIVKTLRKAGFEAYFVGGCVRDQLLGKPIKDYDISTSAIPEEIEGLFRRCLKVGARFGVMVVLMGKDQFEVTTFRSDYDYDGRRPSRVVFVTAQEDVQRRDFTINGILYDPLEDKYIDYVGGREDLEKKTLRAIGKPEDRFEEDRLRMLRGVRFSSTLGYKIEDDTYQAILKMAPRVVEISRERIREELFRILKGPGPAWGMKLLMETSLFQHILPSVALSWKGKEENLLKSLEFLREEREEVSLAMLLLPLSPTESYKILHDSLKCSNEVSRDVVDVLEHHPSLLESQKLSLSDFKRIIRLPNFALHLRVLELLAPSQAEFVRQKKESLKGENLFPPRLITGEDLIRMGYSPGALFSKILRALEDGQLEGKINSEGEAFQWIEKNYPFENRR